MERDFSKTIGDITAEPIEVRIGDVRQTVQLQPLLRPELTSLTADVALPEYLGHPKRLKKDVRGGSVSLVIRAPNADLGRDIRWGRTYESFSDSPVLAAKLSAAAVKGFQQPLADGTIVLACAKHFLADGGTQDGVDQGNAVFDEATLRRVHLAPYVSAVKAGVS